MEVAVQAKVQTMLLVLGLLGLLIGEIIGLFRTTIFKTPSPFKQVIYYYTGNEGILGALDRLDQKAQRWLPEYLRSRFFTGEIGRGTIFDASRTGPNFRTAFEEHFELEFEANSPYTLYSTFMSYMDSRMAAQTHRYQILRIFSLNLIFGAIGAAVITIVLAAQNLGNELVLLVSFISIVVLFLMVGVAFLFTTVAYPLVDLLIIDYYVDRIESR